MHKEMLYDSKETHMVLQWDKAPTKYNYCTSFWEYFFILLTHSTCLLCFIILLFFLTLFIVIHQNTKTNSLLNY